MKGLTPKELYLLRESCRPDLGDALVGSEITVVHQLQTRGLIVWTAATHPIFGPVRRTTATAMGHLMVDVYATTEGL